MFLRTEALRKGESLEFSAKGGICQRDSDIRKLYEIRRDILMEAKDGIV